MVLTTLDFCSQKWSFRLLCDGPNFVAFLNPCSTLSEQLCAANPLSFLVSGASYLFLVVKMSIRHIWSRGGKYHLIELPMELGK